jgi:hypothetical protein
LRLSQDFLTKKSPFSQQFFTKRLLLDAEQAIAMNGVETGEMDIMAKAVRAV